VTAYAEVPSIGTAHVATEIAHHLGEGPAWDPIRQRVLWVDIMAGVVHSGRLVADGRIEPIEHFSFPDTAGAVAVSPTGELVVAGTHRLYYRTADGAITPGATLISGSERRFNDGKPDPAGRLLVGTKGPTDREQLLRIDADEHVTVIDHDLRLSNGLGWTRDGRTLYSIDTWTRRIHRRDYDPVTGATGPRTVFAELRSGYPDGMTLDAEDHLWVAVWGDGCILRLTPRGDAVARIDVPAPHTSCVAFAGPQLDTLVITTATEDLPATDLARYPLSGRLFTIVPGVRGNPPHLWAGASR
jgi:sugar lactone lactonase YvrE